MQNLFGDMLSDLPEVKSFGVAEELEYKAEPQTPYQARQAKLAVTVKLLQTQLSTITHKHIKGGAAVGSTNSAALTGKAYHA